MIQWHLGTMGFSYKDWVGPYYPDGTAARDFLNYYGKVFDSVELDSSFYGTPKREYVRRWAEVTPQQFIFCPKMPRQITHELRLQNAEEQLKQFLDTMRLLGDKLGVTLIQLPPDFDFRNVHTLAQFLRQLPDDLRYAVEFRHPSWNIMATKQLLQANNICWAATDLDRSNERVILTTDFLYIRWIGRQGQYEANDREQQDTSARLLRWWREMKPLLERASSVYGFFSNDYAGHAPATCHRFKELLGLPVGETPPQQGRLL